MITSARQNALQDRTYVCGCFLPGREGGGRRSPGRRSLPRARPERVLDSLPCMETSGVVGLETALPEDRVSRADIHAPGRVKAEVSCPLPGSAIGSQTRTPIAPPDWTGPESLPLGGPVPVQALPRRVLGDGSLRRGQSKGGPQAGREVAPPGDPPTTGQNEHGGQDVFAKAGR